MRKAALIILVALGLFAGAMPAQAATLSWVDPAGDATKPGLPNDDALDVLKTTISSDGKVLKWSATLKKAVEGNPSYSLGYFFVFEFVHSDSVFDLRVAENAKDKAVTFRKVGTGEAPLDRACKDCKYKFDRKAGVVSVEAPIASLAEGIKAADAKAAPFKAGTTISKLLVNSYRGYIAISFLADDAPAPEGTEFKI